LAKTANHDHVDKNARRGNCQREGLAPRVAANASRTTDSETRLYWQRQLIETELRGIESGLILASRGSSG
jgi:hypothetical protein